MYQKKGLFDNNLQDENVQEEVFCMTSGNNSNVVIVGSRKDSSRPIPVVSKDRVVNALKSAERYKKK